MMSNRNDLAALMTAIDTGYQFTAESYPGLATKDEFRFGLQHTLSHITKSQGVLATQLERVDHGGDFDEEELRLMALKQFVNVVKLLCHLGVDVPDIVDHVERQYGQI